MASHVTDAEFPTPLSEKGLYLYQLAHSELSAKIIDSITSPTESSLTFYPVDCHPLTYSLCVSVFKLLATRKRTTGYCRIPNSNYV